MTSIYENNNGFTVESIESGMVENKPVETSLAATLIEQGVESEVNQRFLKTWRKLFASIKTEMGRSRDRETLLTTTVKQIHEKIASDRTLVYRFVNSETGVIASEYLNRGWTPAMGENLPAIVFGGFQSCDYQDAIAINQIAEIDATPYQRQLLEKFQVQSSLAVPVYLQGQTWGLLVVHQCQKTRVWSESEISLLTLVADELGDCLQILELHQQQQLQAQEYKSLTKVIDKIQRASSLEQILQTTTQAARQLINCDRVSVYQFHPDWSGEYVCESVAPGWTPLVGGGIKTVWEDTYLQETQGGRYRHHESMIVHDIYTMGFSPCHVDLLEQFQVRAYITVPVFSGQKLWGILAGYQNSETRTWKESEIELFKHFASSLGVAVSQQESLQQMQIQAQQQAKIATQEKAIAKLISRIRQSVDIKDILTATTQEIRQLLSTQRVGVYRFNPDWSGDFVAESAAPGLVPLMDKGLEKEVLQENGHCQTLQGLATIYKSHDNYLQNTQGGRYQQKTAFVVNDVEKAGFPDCYMHLLEQLEAKAYMTAPIFNGEKLWGLLTVYHSEGARDWQESEINLIKQVAVQFGTAISQAEYIQQTQAQAEKLANTAKRQQDLIALTRKIGEALVEKVTNTSQLEAILQTTVAEVRRLLQTDRTVIYRFNPDWSGDFIAESVAPGWLPFQEKLQNQQINQDLLKENGHCDSIRSLTSIYKQKDSYLQENQGGRYQQKTTFVVNDVTQENFPACYTELLDQFEAKAYLTVPIFKGDQLWGLLASYQHDRTREWQEAEINIMQQIAVLVAVAIQQAQSFEKLEQQSQQATKAAEIDQAVGKVIDKIRKSSDIDSIFHTTTKEVRNLLQADRVVVFKFNPDWSGNFVAESVGANWVRLVDGNHQTYWADSYLQETQGGRYRNREYFVANDMYTAGHAECHLEILEQYQARAYVIVPIFQGENLWGLLAAYQNSGTREWQQLEINLLMRIGDQFGVALQQVEYLQQLERKTQEVQRVAERDRAATKVIDKIRQSIDINEIFSITTKEVRGLLNTDRVAIYRFNPDWGGVFVAESVAPGWVSLVEKQNQIPQLQENISNCLGAGGLLTASDKAQGKQVKDTYLQATQAQELRDRTAFVRSDIHNSGFSQCYVDVLDEYQAKAYAIVPIFQGEKLWGMLAAFENKGTREWAELEVSLLTRIANQLGTTLQQTEYLETLKQQSAQLKAAAEREKQNTEQFQKQAMQLLAAVRPALDGDLTVRAPITEDVLGTIADAYNNTLQALRQIVSQVLGAAEQVAARSNESNASLGSLTGLARQQSKEINEALMEIQQMVDSTQAVVDNAEIVQTTVKQASQTVEKGDAAMNKTVEAIQAIRETVAQTSKKIKRLSESSQKISKVVNLISNFATQTNVLALNAAIEATRAGEYGKGFAVVADEVRSLSRQSAAATIEIEKLVQEIQEETGEVAVAMETGIQQVVEGTNLVSETRQSLNEIVTATEEISELLNKITEATQGQMMQSVSVTASMKDVAQIANKTSSETNNIAVVFQQLSEMAEELLNSMSKFKVN
ncbi:GAF domain-containing protein [Calothrix sp. NIES-3974]|uniref:GAF domain-containing protein n=1 Tax=Calothrix sp. NIES-3974 TaxID=2005462 RepID=UPI000B5E79F5|nr:GAF domain-containing protein [Calothrix sp. NIES-3974]BAZ07348.1 methyl-accepting chemotaxis sensory transducer with phytochrome sensor [Calothrix sp. NIES-3974]